MLKLITGTAGTGKSEYIKQKILENAKKEQKSILIVPEQFSKTAEAEIFSSLEKNSFGFVSVFSFTSLLRDVYSEAGKVLPAVLTDAGKAVIAQKSMQSVYRQLQSFANQRHNVTFSYELCRLFEDFKRNGIDGTQLFAIAQAAPQINSKLKDISLIYSQYSANMTDSGNDMEQLYLQLGQSLPVSYTEKTQIFIDGFESFTHGQYAIIGRMLLMAEDVYISLTADRVFDNTNGTHPLSYTANTAAKLIALAKKLGVHNAYILCVHLIDFAVFNGSLRKCTAVNLKNMLKNILFFYIQKRRMNTCKAGSCRILINCRASHGIKLAAIQF